MREERKYRPLPLSTRMALTGTEHTYPPELRKELVKVFNRFDRDRRASGLKWMLAGATKPTTGRELSNAELAQALERSSAFTQAEWDAFGIRDLGPDDFIKVGQSYFTSTGSGLDAAELKAAFYVMGLQYTDEEIDLIMKEFDIDSSGTIELKEWEKLVYAGLKRKDPDHALVKPPHEPRAPWSFVRRICDAISACCNAPECAGGITAGSGKSRSAGWAPVSRKHPEWQSYLQVHNRHLYGPVS